MILGVDPGNNTGWAILDEAGVLHSCGVGKPPDGSFSLMVIERPQVYPQTSTKQANDLIGLAVSVGGHIERSTADQILVVLPHEWKGSTPKEIHNRRVLNALSPMELTRLPIYCKTKQHNMVDAIGLAKYGFRSRSAQTQHSSRTPKS